MQRLILLLALLIAGGGVTALGAPAGEAAQPFHGGSCQAISATRTVCFEGWGVYKVGASGNVIDLAQRRFWEYTNGVMTFEQRDRSHHVVSGQGRVSIDLFAGTSTPSGLTCKWREQAVVVNDRIVYSVDNFACS